MRVCENYKIIPYESKYLDELSYQIMKFQQKAGTKYFESNIKHRTFTEKFVSNSTSVELKNGYNFNVLVCESFLDSQGGWKKSNVRCIVIDGIVDRVSEIHHLLQQAVESGGSYVIFAREFSNEVMHTIQLNHARGTIDLMPISVPMSEEHMNTLVDIAVVCNTDIVSSIKGDLISAAVQKDLAIIDKIVCSNNNFTIFNNNSLNRVTNHVSNLEKQIVALQEVKDQPIDAIEGKRSLFRQRIRSMNNSTVMVRIGHDDLKSQKNIVEDIDSIFRELTGIILFGNISKSDLSRCKNSQYPAVVKKFKSCILKTYGEKDSYSSISLASSLKFSFSAIKTICSIGCVLFYNE